jgi:hypothetical protein
MSRGSNVLAGIPIPFFTPLKRLFPTLHNGLYIIAHIGYLDRPNMHLIRTPCDFGLAAPDSEYARYVFHHDDLFRIPVDGDIRRLKGRTVAGS